jgi:NAD(P)-dependent dehydrogenase (short-subunit alcohol dehydrogenase family)
VSKKIRGTDLTGKVSLVTGGANGIGLATAQALAVRGASVCILDRDPEAAAAAADSIGKSTRAQTLGLRASVACGPEVQEAFSQCSSALGPIDVLVNNAGILAPNLVNFAEIDIGEIEQMQRVHVSGTTIVTRAVINSMVERGFGRVINVSSVFGLLGVPRRIGYCIAKHAIAGFTRALAVEVARSGVTVNAVAPGFVLTENLKKRIKVGLLDYSRIADRAPAGRWAILEEIAHAIRFFASAASGFITGVVLPVDGGYTIRGDAGESLGPIQYPAALDALRAEVF